MIVYAESSAALAWLLGEAKGPVVLQHLRDASRVVSSRLTLVECERSIRSGVASRRLTGQVADAARDELADASSRWTLAELGSEILARASKGFPHEPLGTLDALHLATAQLLQPGADDFAVLSLDRRVRRNAELLGFTVLPAE